ncbi:unnamed protein product [Ilex paraguariensis]|uniref:HTH La-type RNA-binding domain-containing protein n=1 Tax=Ilex paraguariensis TaxID=185542 RepID=A0ABC8RLC1_9AQUA
MLARQKSMKHRGGGGMGSGPAQTDFSRPPTPPPLPPPFPLFQMAYRGLGPAMLDSTVREPPFKGGSQFHTVNDHSSQRNSSHRGNFGPRPYGDAMHRNGHGVRHNQGREWNGPRGSNARDVHMPQQMAPPPPRGFIQSPPPSPSPFIAPSPVRPYANPMGFDMVGPFYYLPTLPPDSFRGVPFVAHGSPPPPPPPPMFYPLVDLSLPALLLNQIDYYFSDENLVKDNFLRSKMDDHGWVPITLIASFPRVQCLTSNIQFILDSLRASTVVEVQGDKVRRHNEWRKWLPANARFPTDSGSQSPGGSTDDVLAASFQVVSLNGVTTDQNSNLGAADNHVEVFPGRYSSEELTGQSSLANGECSAEEAYSSVI